nr:DUF4229 domain-containing protein [Microcella frigidaquae]
MRLGLFGVTFGVLMAIQLDWWWAAIVASIIAMTVSYIFFGTLRDAVALDLAARREKPAADPDAEAEDAAADPSSSSPSSPTP